MEMKNKMETVNLANFDNIDSLEKLEKVCKAIADDAIIQLQELVFSTDAASNESRVACKARKDLAISLLTRIKK
ncbi:hypothetical protein [Paenibacillus medicaginis]|uniref:Uncharacterized protein n=1 Tax=Paenibacillus medicaginis TaxID=1470560 RepID=A0ABV5C1D9_9BACL